MNPLLLVTVVPIIAGILGFSTYRLRNEFNFLGTIITLYYSLYLFITARKQVVSTYELFTFKNINFGFYLDAVGGILLLAVALTGFLILLYSLRYMRNYKHMKTYYLFLLITISIANAAILANNLFFLVILSTLSLIFLGIFLILTTENTSSITSPTFLIVGLSNILILLGILILQSRFGNVSIVIDSHHRIIASDPILITSFFLILIGILGKIGLIPLHFWTLRVTKSPVTISTFIPMILDKIVGVYLLFRISYCIFNISETQMVRLVILCIGAISIIIAAILMIKEKDTFRFLTFSSIIQLGLIFIGIGCANPFGIGGGFYHLINYLMFQPSLLLTIGSIEYWTKSTQFNSLEGLGAKMPLTFFALLIAALASVGAPPFNGFFSKWLLFQGILKMNVSPLSMIFIIIAIFGSIINIIYFLKFLYSFQGKEIKVSQRIRDPGFTMWFPPVVLSVLCIILGISVYSLSWRTIILPTLRTFFPGQPDMYPWTFSLAPILLIASLLIGIIIFYITRPKIINRA